MFFNNYNSTDTNLPIKICNAVLEKGTQFKLFGIIIQINLHWKAHINSLALQIVRNIEIIIIYKIFAY